MAFMISVVPIILPVYKILLNSFHRSTLITTKIQFLSQINTMNTKIRGLRKLTGLTPFVRQRSMGSSCRSGSISVNPALSRVELRTSPNRLKPTVTARVSLAGTLTLAFARFSATVAAVAGGKEDAAAMAGEGEEVNRIFSRYLRFSRLGLCVPV